jgi:transcription initiation factor TFIIH subunit 4
LEYQLPNLVVAALTKESVNTALASGISAEQIISFLRKHAHPHVAQRIPVVPETVSDQLRLWETDRNRVELEPAYFYDDFPTVSIYEAVVQHARELGGLLFEDASNRRLVVRADLHEDMRQFIRKQSNAAPAQRR